MHISKVVCIDQLECFTFEADIGAEAGTSQSYFFFKRDEELNS